MEDNKLHTAFEKAVALANATKIKFPQDVLLQFYAYYKHATKADSYRNTNNDSNEDVLRNAFKINALVQTNNITEDEAKQKYIELVNTYIKNQ